VPDKPDKPEQDERISLHGHDAEDVLRALLKVDPDAPPAKRNEDEPVEDREKRVREKPGKSDDQPA
jgi:hypothetical protein